MDRDQVGQRERAAFRLEVQPLPAHHPLDAAGAEQLHRHPAQRGRRERECVRRRGEHAGGHRHQQEARPGRGGDVEGDVGGGTAAAEVVVVHAGKVVVDQGVGVHGLDRGGDPGDRRRTRRRPRGRTASRSAARTRLPGVASA